jgi:glutamate racemase
VVRNLIGPHVAVVDSALATAAHARTFLLDRSLDRRSTLESGKVHLIATDVTRSFREVANRFLGAPFGEVELIDL